VADAKHHSAHDGEGEKKAHGCDKEAAARAIGNAFVQERAETECDEKRSSSTIIPAALEKNNIVEKHGTLDIGSARAASYARVAKSSIPDAGQDVRRCAITPRA